VNFKLHPDLVLCLHFNAEGWGDPNNPELTDTNHLHLLVNGSYLAEELEFDDERFEMIRRLLSRAYDEELPLADTIATAMGRETGLPSYQYPTTNSTTKVGCERLCVCRAICSPTRLYRCPVVYCEPYVMNSKRRLRSYSGWRLRRNAQRQRRGTQKVSSAEYAEHCWRTDWSNITQKRVVAGIGDPARPESATPATVVQSPRQYRRKLRLRLRAPAPIRGVTTKPHFFRPSNFFVELQCFNDLFGAGKFFGNLIGKLEFFEKTDDRIALVCRQPSLVCGDRARSDNSETQRFSVKKFLVVSGPLNRVADCVTKIEKRPAHQFGSRSSFATIRDLI